MTHPNIVPVRDFVEHSGLPGLVLPLIEGPSLEKLLASYRPQEAESIALFTAIVHSVAHAHQRGLIHRDLKPANILLDSRTGRITPCIADFGLVKDLHEPQQTRQGIMMGTLCYAAPEQTLDAAGVTPQADLFSLGVILVELLTGVRVFQASSQKPHQGARESLCSGPASPPSNPLKGKQRVREGLTSLQDALMSAV